MLIFVAEISRRGESVIVKRITAIGTDNDPDELVLETVAEYENGDGNIPAEWQRAASAALKKSYCYHCREPHYIKEGSIKCQNKKTESQKE